MTELAPTDLTSGAIYWCALRSKRAVAEFSRCTA